MYSIKDAEALLARAYAIAGDIRAIDGNTKLSKNISWKGIAIAAGVPTEGQRLFLAAGKLRTYIKGTKYFTDAYVQENHNILAGALDAAEKAIASLKGTRPGSERVTSRPLRSPKNANALRLLIRDYPGHIGVPRFVIDGQLAHPRGVTDEFLAVVRENIRLSRKDAA